MKIKNNTGIFIILSISYFIIATNEVIFSESQKSWVAENLFSENYRFLNSTFGPLYLIYLKILKILFEYPHFIKVELYISSTIYLIFFYNLLKIFFDDFESFFITVAFIPLILIVESRQNLLAAAFFNLYLIKISKNNSTTYFPLSLIVASLLSRTFIPLLAINFIINIFTNRKKILKKNFFCNKINYLKIFLLIIFILNLNFQLKDNINNHMLYDTKYAPNINFNNPLEVGFFQFNNQKISNKKGIEKEDWYLSFKKNYNDNNSLYKVLLNDPNILIRHVIENIPLLIYQINEIIFSKGLGKINLYFQILLCIINLFFIIKTLIIFYKKKNKISYLPILIYLPIFILSTLIVNPTGRYVTLLLPVYALLFYNSLKEILKVNFKIILIILTIIFFHNNYSYYSNVTKHNFIETKNIQKYLESLDPNKLIFTNQKNLLSVINSNGKIYLGFDSVPPYYDKKIFDYIKKFDIIIFTKDAKKYDDISTKQGDKYLHYIKPYLKNNDWENIKIDDFIILVNKKKL